MSDGEDDDGDDDLTQTDNLGPTMGDIPGIDELEGLGVSSDDEELSEEEDPEPEEDEDL